MGGVFCKPHGTSKEELERTSVVKGTISSTDKAVLDLKNARDRLSRYRKKLNADEEKLLARARALHDDNQKNMAIKLMQLRKHKLKEVENVEQQLLNVLQLVETIQSTQNTQEVFKALASGKSALEALHNEMSVDDVLTLLDEVEEQNEIENQINTVLREDAVMTTDDEAEIERELAALMAGSDNELLEDKEEEKDDDLAEALPHAPTTELPGSSIEIQQQTEQPEKKVPVAM